MRQDTATISRAILHCSWSENAQTVVKRSSCPFGVGACRPQARIGLAKFTVQLLYPGWHINLNCRFRNRISQSIVLEVFPSAFPTCRNIVCSLGGSAVRDFRHHGRVRLLPNRVVIRHPIDACGSAGASPSHQLETQIDPYFPINDSRKSFTALPLRVDTVCCILDASGLDIVQCFKWRYMMSVTQSRAVGLAVIAICLGLMAGCKSEAPAAAPTPPPEVTVSQPSQREVTDFLEFTGRTESPQFVEVRARVSGQLQKINFQDGQEIKKDEPLFEIDPRPFDASLGQAKAALARAEAVLEQTTAQVARYQELRKSNAVSQQDLEISVADKGVAMASKAGAQQQIVKAELDVEFAKITAPIAGRVSRANVAEGNQISPSLDPSGVLTTIVSLDPMYVYFNVDEQSLLHYKEMLRKSGAILKFSHVKELKLPVKVALAGESGFPHLGQLDFLDNQVNSSTGTIRARAALPNQDRTFVPGLFTRVRLPIGGPHKELLVLDRAIATDQNLRYVLIVNEKDEVERRDVQLGSVFDGERVITTGLKPTDWVIVNGIQRARPGAKVKPQKKTAPK